MKVLLAFFVLFLLGACSNANNSGQSDLSVYKELFNLTCEGLDSCGDGVHCENNLYCFKGLCAKGPICIKTSLACFGQCGTTNCNIEQSYPAQISFQ